MGTAKDSPRGAFGKSRYWALAIFALLIIAAVNVGYGSATPSGAISARSSIPVQNAIRAAKDYLQVQGFSRQGLIDQLSSRFGDGYSVSVATAAVNSLNVNWNAEAVQAAKDYLKTQPFSCQGLVQQLSSAYGDKFTLAQAQYAARRVHVC